MSLCQSVTGQLLLIARSPLSHLDTYPFPEGVDEDASVDTEGEADAEGPVDSDHVLVEPHRPRPRGATRLRSFRRRRQDAQTLPPSQPSAEGGAEEGARRRAPRVRRC